MFLNLPSQLSSHEIPVAGLGLELPRAPPGRHLVQLCFLLEPSGPHQFCPRHVQSSPGAEVGGGEVRWGGAGLSAPGLQLTTAALGGKVGRSWFYGWRVWRVDHSGPQLWRGLIVTTVSQSV